MPDAVGDVAPTASVLTGHDQQHAVTYLRLLDADAESADWKEVARIVLRIDPERSPSVRGAPSRPISPAPAG